MFIKGYQDRYIFRKAFEEIMPESLYKLQSKDEKSLQVYWKNNSKSDFEKKQMQREARESVAAKIDLKLWREFVDMDMLQRWVSDGESAGITDEEVIYLISAFYGAESMIRKARTYLID